MKKKYYISFLITFLIVLSISLFWVFSFYDFLPKSNCFEIISKPKDSVVEIYKINNLPYTDSYLLVLSSKNNYKYSFHIGMNIKPAIFQLGNYGVYKFLDYLVWYQDPADGDEYPITYKGVLLGDGVCGDERDKYSFKGNNIYFKKYDDDLKKYLEISLKYTCKK